MKRSISWNDRIMIRKKKKQMNNDNNVQYNSRAEPEATG